MRKLLVQLRRRLADRRGRRVVLLSHCLLDQNVRYLGGAEAAGGVPDVVDRYLAEGTGIHQLPCPERHAWGGVEKRGMLLAFGAAGTPRAPAVRLLSNAFLRWTRLVYDHLARRATREVRAYRRAGVEVVGFVGVADSPSCGVHSTLDLRGAIEAVGRCPLEQLDPRTLNRDVVAAHTRAGEGMFTAALRRRLRDAGVEVPFAEHRPALPDELPAPGARET
ncbi:2-thiouracil desulfurase family protein [Nocardioides koreensis]|uniref:2-thiouracil desulfurase family protein n=1 Tax=Nocardioides koreensis TaxID=433651 RepID=A0ABN3A8P1_9ACTN